MMTNTRQTISCRKVAAILMMAAGWGWMNGNFVPDNSIYLYNALIHCIPLVILLILALRFFRPTAADIPGRTNTGIGLTIFAVVQLVLIAIGIALGATNPDPNAFGVKTLPDWFATSILTAGSLLWLTTLIPVRRSATHISPLQNR